MSQPTLTHRGTPRVRHLNADRYVYFVRQKLGGLIKIGVANDPFARFVALQTASPYELELLGVIRSATAAFLEKQLHSRFHASLVRGEWFQPAPELCAYIEANALSDAAVRRQLADSASARVKAWRAAH